MYIALILTIPFLISWGIFVWSRGKFSWREFLILQVVTTLIVCCGYGIARWSAVSDTEIISGRIQEKRREEVSCSHSYSCNCVTITNTDKTTTTRCQTCYEHSYDVNWWLNTNAMAESIYVDREDSQGLITPSRWKTAYVGEPVAVPHQFENYLLLKRDSILTPWVGDLKKYPVPPYPNQVHDLYKLNRLMTIGFTEPRAREWNAGLSEIAGDLGPTKQVQPLVVMINSTDTQWANAIQHAWVGGKKNDFIVILGVPKYPKISWVRIVSWTKVESLKISLKDDIWDLNTVSDPFPLLQLIREHLTQSFIRTPWSNYAYLNAQYEPSFGATVFLWALALLVNIGGSMWFHYNDLFDDRTYRYSRKFTRRF